MAFKIGRRFQPTGGSTKRITKGKEKTNCMVRHKIIINTKNIHCNLTLHGKEHSTIYDSTLQGTANLALPKQWYHIKDNSRGYKLCEILATSTTLLITFALIIRRTGKWALSVLGRTVPNTVTKVIWSPMLTDDIISDFVIKVKAFVI